MTALMTPWLQFLEQQGARFDENRNASLAELDHRPAQHDISRGFVAPLTDFGLIAADGDDAASFLHNQLTNDVEHLAAAEVRLAGYCSPKGRLLATFRMWKTGGSIMLQVPREIQAPVQKRLQMFVLRAKAKLRDADEAHAQLGLGGKAAAQALQHLFVALPATAGAKVDGPNGTLLRVEDAFGFPRYEWIAPVEVALQTWSTLKKTLLPVGSAMWHLADIQSGIPQIKLATQEQFVPQMVNYELVGGVNFKKGCYPGQEIVARSQYLGKLKRRTVLAAVDTADCAAGIEVFSSADPEQPCGMIVNAAANLEGGSDCLVELKIAAMEEGSIHLGTIQGPVLHFRPLPYSLQA